jgi:hypothetical protein
MNEKIITFSKNSGDTPLNPKHSQSKPLRDKAPAAEKHPHAPSSDATE